MMNPKSFSHVLKFIFLRKTEQKCGLIAQAEKEKAQWMFSSEMENAEDSRNNESCHWFVSWAYFEANFT